MSFDETRNVKAKGDKLNLSAVETGLEASQKTVAKGNQNQQGKSVLH